MTSQWKRLAVAAGLSLTCAGGTILWYYSTGDSAHTFNEAPLAQVAAVSDEVLKRPATRLLWQSVNTGDNLYNGETIRTSSQGEMRIQFENGNYIDLEPDSLIVLQQSQGEISLDLMAGSLFVDAKAAEGETGKSGLVLNSKNGKVDLSGASASLAKGSGERVDVQVLEGKATIQGSDGKEKEITSGKASTLGANGDPAANVVTLSPLPNTPLFIDPNEAKPVTFRWQGYSPQYQVAVHMGTTKRNMKEIARTDKAGETKLSFKPPAARTSKFFFQLVAIDPTTQNEVAKTIPSRVEILHRTPPTVLFPVADSLEVEQVPHDLTFKWEKTAGITRVQLEVAGDPLMRKLITNKAFANETQLTVPQLPEGDYYWRISSYYAGVEKPVAGSVNKLNLFKKKPIRKEPVHLAWTVPQDKLEQVFLMKPELNLSWQPKNRTEDIASYRVRLAHAEDAAVTPVHMNSKDPQIKAEVPKPGRYIASIEAIGLDGQVIGSSETLQLAAKEIPLLNPPLLQPAEGDLKARMDGHTDLTWIEVQGAKEYWLTVFDKNGKEVSRSKFSGTKGSLKNLMPGEYGLQIQATDEWGREGRAGPRRTLIVPDKSGLKAPTLKKIKVN